MRDRLRRVVAGDRDSAAWLFDTFAPRLFRRLRQRYGYPGGPDPDDLVQDTYILLFQHQRRVLARFLDRAPAELTEAALERYLWDLACGVASNRRRARARRKVVPLFEDEDIRSETTVEREAVERDRLERLDQCLRGRRERVYLYYKLRHRDGLEPQEIVQVTGWSRKATYKLKQALDEAVRLCAEHLGLDASTESS